MKKKQVTVKQEDRDILFNDKSVYIFPEGGVISNTPEGNLIDVEIEGYKFFKTEIIKGQKHWIFEPIEGYKQEGPIKIQTNSNETNVSAEFTINIIDHEDEH